MTHRVPLRADLIRDRNALYRELPDGSIENVYTLKITNMDDAAHTYAITALDNPSVSFDLSRSLELAGGEVAGFSVRIRMPKNSGQGTQKLKLQLTSVDEPAIQKGLNATMLLPISGSSTP
jgi:polyferredoxin